MSQQGTIVAQKQRFLLSRKQYLSRGIAPSEKLKQIAHEGGIDLGMLKGVVDKSALPDCNPDLFSNLTLSQPTASSSSTPDASTAVK